MIGESPTLPQRFPVMPPVDVPAARCPRRSSTATPTVPFLLWVFLSHCSLRRSVEKNEFSTSSTPLCLAKVSAPSPANSTCRVSVITFLARVMGWRTFRTPATAPQERSEPSMMDASSSCFPSELKTAPLPALNSGSSSRYRITCSTASIPSPPLRMIPVPIFSADVSDSW